jgi:Skp family chaperone for outer membrane proteins
MSDYWGDYAEYDAVAEELKESLRNSVKEEITKRIESLETENRELKGKLEGLSALEREAERAKAEYERAFSTAKYEATREARKEKLSELLGAIDERLYTVEQEQVKRDKCERCNTSRQIAYKTPLGNDAVERCVCANFDYRWKVEAIAAHEVSRRNGQLVIWWASESRWKDSDTINPRVLKPAEGAEAEDLLKYPSGYSFKDEASAQAAADASNGRAQ